MNWRAISHAWYTYWFEPASILNIALFRIGLGLILLINACLLFPDWESLFSRHSLVSNQDAIGLWWQNTPHVDLFLLLANNHQFSLALLIVYAIVSLNILLGLFTRVSCVLALLLNYSISNHCAAAATEVDELIRFSLLILSLAPSGKALSFDNILHSLTCDWRQEGFQAALSPRWCLRVLQLQICLAYLISSLWQLNNPDWLSGDALQMLVHSEDAGWLQMPLFDLVLVSRFFTWGWCIFGLIFPFFIWVKEARYWVLGSGIILQLALALTLTTPLYHWFFIASSVLFFYPSDLRSIWQAVKSFVSDGKKIYTFYDEDKLEDVYTVGVLHRLDVFGRLQFVESTIKLPGIVTSNRQRRIALLVDGEEKREGEAVSYMLQKLPLLWLFLPLLRI